MNELYKSKHTCPVSPIQKQFWLVNHLHPDSSAYNIPSVFLMKGILDAGALERSLKEIVHRHENFRTTVVASEGEPVQEIWQQVDFFLSVDDVSESDLAKSDEAVNNLIKVEVTRPFNLAKGPLIRCRLFKLDTDQHLLIIVMHHIIVDLRTKDLFSDELSLFYNSYVAKKPISLAKPMFHYSEYASWYQEFQKNTKYDEMLSFWEKKLGRVNDYLNLPIVGKRPPIKSLQGEHLPFDLPEVLTEKLKHFSQQNNTDIFLTLLTAYAVLLGRYSSQTDFVVGVPLTNRRNENHKNIMGCCMNILPIAIDLSGDPDFKTMLRRVRMMMLEAHRNQEAVFESIVDTIQPKRDASYNPVFQVGFAFEHPMNLSLDGLEITSLPAHCRGSQLDIFATFWESEKQVSGYFEYSTQLFSSKSVKQFAQSYTIFLSELVENTGTPVAMLPLIGEKEKNKILVKWNDTAKYYPEKHVLHEIFENQVKKTPNATALVFNHQKFNYSEFNKDANKLANYIIQSNIKPGTYIGIYMNRSIEMMIAIYGIMKSGCAYVPFDPEFPFERLQFMLEDTKVPIILTQKHLSRDLYQLATKTVELDSEWESIEKYSGSNPDVEITPDTPAYVVFTSGSTGRPKGVVNSHRGICNRLLWMQEEYKLSDQESVLQKTPFSFDVSVWEFFWPLMTGARLIIAPPEEHRDPSALVRLITENKVTIIHFVPSMLHAFMENPMSNTCTCLNQVFCSGEALQYDDQEKFFSIFTAELHNLYGPTEAAVDVTYWACKKNSKSSIVPIGRPVSNTQIYILDKFLNPLPVGIQGELHIGGVQVASGYLQRPGLTKEKFIPNPFSNKSGAKLYKTGDLARFLQNGIIEYMGRIDHQVKVSGLRIELGEIESVLCEHPGVSQSAVTVKDYGVSDKRLVAYIVPDKIKKVCIEEVKKHMQTKLPNSMVPSLFVLLKKMPLTPNGKVDRRKLPEPKSKHLDNIEGYVAPRTDFENIVKKIWSKILKIDQIGVHENFFEIGGTSLLCVLFISQLQVELNQEISVIKAFQHPTIYSFAQFLEMDRLELKSSPKIQKKVKLLKKALKKKRFIKNINR